MVLSGERHAAQLHTRVAALAGRANVAADNAEVVGGGEEAVLDRLSAGRDGAVAARVQTHAVAAVVVSRVDGPGVRARYYHRLVAVR